MLGFGEVGSLACPVVLKPLSEGSSIDVTICHDQQQLDQAIKDLHQNYRSLLVEKFIAGKEFTVGVIDTPDGHQALPPIQIVPASGCYDYEAKYDRDDTGYVLDPAEMGVSSSVIQGLRDVALEAHRLLGCRHLSRVDFHR